MKSLKIIGTLEVVKTTELEITEEQIEALKFFYDIRASEDGYYDDNYKKKNKAIYDTIVNLSYEEILEEIVEQEMDVVYDVENNYKVNIGYQLLEFFREKIEDEIYEFGEVIYDELETDLIPDRGEDDEDE